jgi:hypothetical protein
MRHAVSPSSRARLPHIVTDRSADKLGEMQSQIHRAFTRSFTQPFDGGTVLDKLRMITQRTHDR